MTKSKVPNNLTKSIMALVVAAGVGTGGVYMATEQTRLDNEAIDIAMLMGAYYESSNKHIGKPYIDYVGKGRPWTVCNGITGPKVNPNKYYTEAECKEMEGVIYMQALSVAKANFKYWPEYNVFVRATFLDTIWNVPSAITGDTTLMRKANSGDLVGACKELPRWVYGTKNGVKVRLTGLVDRRDAGSELCAEWGQDGHFSTLALDTGLIVKNDTVEAVPTLPAEPVIVEVTPTIEGVLEPEVVKLPWWKRLFSSK